MLQNILLKDFTTNSGKTYNLPLSYQTFGKKLHSAPIVLINHALTGNSNVAGENGWWKEIVGKNKPINLNQFTVICFNIPGNGFDDFYIENHQDFTLQDIARIFIEGLKALEISKLHCIIAGSIGGSIGWELLALEPKITNIFIPIATDYKTSDWLFAQCFVQKNLLESSEKPLEKARIHAMLCYRTPESLNLRFKREKLENGTFKSHDWLDYHGNALKKRFSLKAYQLVNHLLININVSEEKLSKIEANIHLISIDSDLFFPAFEIKKTFEFLNNKNKNVHYHEMQSIHGHDAFLMEYEQLSHILKNII